MHENPRLLPLSRVSRDGHEREGLAAGALSKASTGGLIPPFLAKVFLVPAGDALLFPEDRT